MKFKLKESLSDIILYNGSDVDFKEIDFSKINVHDDGYLGRGFYLTENADYALEYGKYLKKFKVKINNPFSFTTISTDDKYGLIEAVLKHYGNKISECSNFIYWLNRKSNDATLKYCAKKFINSDIQDDDIIYVLEIILSTPEYIYDGALMDFSDILTPYIKSQGYDGCYISAEGYKYQEVVIYDKKQVYLIK